MRLLWEVAAPRRAELGGAGRCSRQQDRTSRVQRGASEFALPAGPYGDIGRPIVSRGMVIPLHVRLLAGTGQVDCLTKCGTELLQFIAPDTVVENDLITEIGCPHLGPNAFRGEDFDTAAVPTSSEFEPTQRAGEANGNRPLPQRGGTIGSGRPSQFRIADERGGAKPHSQQR